MSTASPSDLLGRQFDLLDVREPWLGAIGRIEQPAYALVSGPPGAGKSTFMLALAGHELARHGKVMFNSAEEMLGVTLAQKLARLGIESDNLILGEYQDIDRMKYAAEHEGVDFLVVDSISEMDPRSGQVESLRSFCKQQGIGLWLIAHELKNGGGYKGPSNLGHGTDVVARVNEDGEFVASKNRYAQTGEATSVPFSATDLPAAGDGAATRENPSVRVRKLDDYGENTPGRLDRAWLYETLDVPFDVKPWHTDPEKFAKRFSLGGVEFGRWMEADDRAEFMAWAAQGFNDFCDLFGVPYTRLGFGGRIKLALGARGNGGRVAAHYEPTPRHTINLTKPNGKGSLAHEYAHALDNMAGVRWDLKTFASGGRSERTAPVLSEMEGSDALAHLERFFAALYFDEIDESGEEDHAMREWARQLHHEGTRAYYKQRAEVLARSLEVHVRHGLDEKKGEDWNTWLAKRNSTYLNSGVYPQKYILQGEGGAGVHLTGFVQRIFDQEIEMRENPAGARPNPGEACVVGGNWRRNREKGGVEIRFDDVPPPAVRERLKEHGFIFAFQKQMWFADATEDTLALARELIGEGDGAAPAAEATRRQQQEIDRMVREARAEVREARKELDRERKKYIERGATGADLQRAIQPFEDAVAAAQRHAIEVEQEAREGRVRLGQSERTLFEEARENPAAPLAGHLTQIGTCMELETSEAVYEAAGERYPMFTGPEGRVLLICPSRKVKPASEAALAGMDASAEAGAAEMYETWHGFEPDGDVEIALDGGAWKPAGTAERIVYQSDKIVRAGDFKGNPNLYEHGFDAGQRKVYEWGCCLVVTDLMIDKRGILN